MAAAEVGVAGISVRERGRTEEGASGIAYAPEGDRTGEAALRDASRDAAGRAAALEAGSTIGERTGRDPSKASEPTGAMDPRFTPGTVSIGARVGPLGTELRGAAAFPLVTAAIAR